MACRSAAAGSACRRRSPISQVALCFGLLVGANLMVRSFLAMQRADLGFDHRPILSARGYLAGDAFDEVPARAAFYRQVVDHAGRVAGRVGRRGDHQHSRRRWRSGAPAGDRRTDGRGGRGQRAVDRHLAGAVRDHWPAAASRGGRLPNRKTENPDANVAVINQRLAQRLWPDSSPIDRRIGFRFGDEYSVAARDWRRAGCALRGDRRGHGTVAAQCLRSVRDGRLAIDGDAGARAGLARCAGRAGAGGAAAGRPDVPDLPVDADAGAAPLYDVGAGILRQPDGGVRGVRVAAGVPRHLRADFVLGRPALARDRRAGSRSARGRRT